ncbi:Flp pilus assembly protein CpaB, partial [Alcaligenes pakistanensis]
TLTLDVGPDDALKLLAARQHGRISALLRNPDDHTPHQAAVRGELADILG